MDEANARRLGAMLFVTALLALHCRFPDYDFEAQGSGGSAATGGGAGASAMPSCNDDAQNGTESDIDCGGDCARKCDDGQLCEDGAQDCKSQACGNDGRCVAAACNDDLRNGDETDVDCGGSCPGKCEVGGGCELGARDCASAVCGADSLCAAPSCVDAVMNGDEVDVDCGPDCAPCGIGSLCTAPEQCASGLCTGGRCDAGLQVYYAAATTDDGVAIKPDIRLVNVGQDTFSLADVELRYYLTTLGEGSLPLLFEDISASVVSARNIDQYVAFDLVPMSAVDGADGYVSITFASAAGELLPADILDIAVSIGFAANSGVVQGNDYSFDALAAQGNLYDRIPVYVLGEHSWGTDPP